MKRESPPSRSLDLYYHLLEEAREVAQKSRDRLRELRKRYPHDLRQDGSADRRAEYTVPECGRGAS